MAGHTEAAATVGGAGADIAATRKCTIEIMNETKDFSLLNPSMYIESGSCDHPLQPVIKPSESGNAQFVKTPNTLRGSVGVFTYDLLKKNAKQYTEKIAVMFSVPYDFNMYSNWYAVGIFAESKECNYDLYYEMYNDTGKLFVRGEAKGPDLIYKGDHVTVTAAMSDSYQSVIKLHVRDH